MGFEDDMIENGFTDAHDYMDYLYDEAERLYAIQEERERRLEEYAEESRHKFDKLKEEFRERLEKERIIKLWAKENLEKARLWYAHYYHTTEFNKERFEQFIENLGKSRSWALGANDNPDMFNKWKHWLEDYESYQEFKKEAPEEWQEFKESKYDEYIDYAIYRLIKYDIDSDNCIKLGLYYSGVKGSIDIALKTINKWIDCNSKLWEDSILKYGSCVKTDEEYLYQAWLDKSSDISKLTIWKNKNPLLWKQFKAKCRTKEIKYEDIYSEWIKRNSKEWDRWKQLNYELYDKEYTCHKIFLWYVYTEIQWVAYLKEKIAKEELAKKLEEKVVQESKLNDKEDNGEDEIINEEDYIPDEYIYEQTNEEDNELIEYDSIIDDSWELGYLYDEKDYKKYLYLEHGDPREEYKCNTSQEEDSIHDEIIVNLKKDLSENEEKLLFVKSHCSDYDFDRFVHRKIFSDSDIRIEETPEEYADRKIMDLWISQHKKRWDNWVCRYLWYKEQSVKVDYDETAYYEFWKEKELNKWIKNNFRLWKQNAQKVDIWFKWFLNNKWHFHEWASLNIRSWGIYINESMRGDCSYSFNDLSNPYVSFDEWRKNKPNEWNRWKDIIKEKVLLDEFRLNYFYYIDSYIPKYKLKLQIQEKIYLHRLGKNIFHDHLAVIENEGKMGYINEAGEIVIDIQYDKAQSFNDGIAAVKVGETICKDYISELDEYVESKVGGRWGIINIKGDFIVEPQFDDIKIIRKDFIIFSKGGELKKINDCTILVNSKWGIMDINMHEIIPASYDYLKSLDNGLFAAKKDYKWALLSNNGIKLTPFKYSYIYNSEGDYFVANINSKYLQGDYYDGKWGYIDTEGNELAPFFDADDKDGFIMMWEGDDKYKNIF